MTPRAKQHGMALLVFITLAMTIATALFVQVLNSNNIQLTRDKISSIALAQAKEALIGYAITYHDTHPGEVHGYLPCPDKQGGSAEGSAELSCGGKNISAIGRLPWRTIDLTPLRGGARECLWYAVSGTYKNNPKTDLMNWDTNGQFLVYGSDGTTLLTPEDNQAVAVIFAPGNAQAGQNRSNADTPYCGGNYTASNYLDSDGEFNNASVSVFAHATSRFRQGHSAQINDRLIFITRQDIWNALQKHQDFLQQIDLMTRKTAECIAHFGSKNNTAANKSLPWPAPLILTDYADPSRYNDSSDLFAGRPPYRVNFSQGQSGNTTASPFNLLQANGTNCPAGWADIYPWWSNWKDHLFYALSYEYRPNTLATQACGHCLQVNNSATRYAALLLFAGNRLEGQTRISDVSDTRRGVASNYLEAGNASNLNNFATGQENYQLDTASNTYNDIIYCIKQDLTVVKGDAAATPPCP